MKNYIFYFSMLLSTILSNGAAHAQNNPFVGMYNGSRMELVYNLYILPKHEFVIELTYGSEDRLIIGSWKDDDNNGLILQEEPRQAEPFVVYTNSEPTGGKRRLSFKYFAQNTQTALAFGAPFQASKLKYILKPDEHTFSYEYNMDTLKNNSKIIYLSCSLSESTHEIYTFEPGDNVGEMLIMYNSQYNQPVFNARAAIKDGKLYLSYEDERTDNLGKKQPLPVDIEKQVDNLKGYNIIPDTVKINRSEKILTFKRIHAKSIFKAEVSIPMDLSYFGDEENKDEADEANVTPIPTVPSPGN